MITILVDIDGTALEYPERVNDLHLRKETSVILHTSRPEFLRDKTIQELQEKGILYDALIMGKPKADYYIDDKNANFDLEYGKLV